MHGNKVLVALALATALGASDAAWAHGYLRGYWGGYYGGYYGPRAGVYVAAPWYWEPSWYWGAPAYGYPYPYAYGYGYPWRYGPAVRDAVAPVDYVERSASAAQGGSWYYCSDPPGYFPHVSLCSRPWLEVAPFPVGNGVGRPRAP